MKRPDRSRLTRVVTSILALLFLLSACGIPADGGAKPEPAGSDDSSQPSSAPDLKSGVISETCETPSQPEGCVIVTDDCHPWEFAAANDSEQIGGWKLQIPVDGGSREFATGDPELDSSGVPVAYTVAPGDIPDLISERFCINLAYLNAINGVRRQGAMNLFVGDTLNFDAHTILTVGDQNGVVYDHPPPSPMPPQR